jgi:hypothetical protein
MASATTERCPEPVEKRCAIPRVITNEALRALEGRGELMS